MASNRKPHNDTAGYVCERRHPKGGWLMLLDRDNGGDWIDADERWILVRLDAVGSGLGTLGVQSKAMAYDIINNECRHGIHEIDWGDEAEAA